MSNQNSVVKRERVALKFKTLGQFIRECEKAVTKSEEHGDTVWFDKVTWSDGSVSLGGYNGETKKRYNLGKVFPPREQEANATSAPFETVQKTQEVQDDLPF